MRFKIALILLLTGLFTLFVLQNIAHTEVRFLFWSIELSRALLLFLVFGGGLFTGWLLHTLWRLRK